jgi:hypothetical protein
MLADRLTLLLCLALLAATITGPPAQDRMTPVTRPIDVEHSTVTVFADTAGLFAAFAHDHLIAAPISAGTIAYGVSPAIEFIVNAGDLMVLDPDLDSQKRMEVRTRMLGPEVLDTARFPTIRVESTTIASAGDHQWTVAGRLTIRGITRVVTFAAHELNERYRGEFKIKQRDFGIEPVRVAAGTVSVKDELRIAFEIAPL